MTAMPQNLLEALDDTALGTSEVGGERTVFRAFEVGEFLEWPAWRRLLRILRSNGGSFGLSGARGAGKSWLMLRAIEWVRGADGTGRLGGIGLWYPSPSEYDPLAFLASLSDSFGTEIDRWFRRNPKVRRRHAMERGAFVVAGGAAAFLFLNQLVNQPWLPWTVVAAAVLAAGFGVVLWAIRRGPGSFPRESRRSAQAKVVREAGALHGDASRDLRARRGEGGRGQQWNRTKAARHNITYRSIHYTIGEKRPRGWDSSRKRRHSSSARSSCGGERLAQSIRTRWPA